MKLTKIAVVVLLSVMVISGIACNEDESTQPTPSPVPSGTFEIYLISNDRDWGNCSNVSNIQIVGEPVLSDEHILSYNWSTHTIEMTEEGGHRLSSSIGGHTCPLLLVVANGEPIYLFTRHEEWYSIAFPLCPFYFSYAFDEYNPPYAIRIQFWSSSGSSQDLRSDERIYQALAQAGILVD